MRLSSEIPQCFKNGKKRAQPSLTVSVFTWIVSGLRELLPAACWYSPPKFLGLHPFLLTT